MVCKQCGHDDGIAHVHKWTYNPVVNAMFCRCGDRVECDHRLPAAMAHLRITNAVDPHVQGVTE